MGMNERQQAHINYFLERVAYWRGLKRDYWAARMLGARDADQAHPLRSEEEGAEVFEYLSRLEREEGVGTADRDGPAPADAVPPRP
jgi:hypothetical protein